MQKEEERGKLIFRFLLVENHPFISVKKPKCEFNNKIRVAAIAAVEMVIVFDLFLSCCFSSPFIYQA
jgi:hypothetical protein